MPQIHLGVYLTSGDETVNAVRWALEVDFEFILSIEKIIADEAPRLVIERNGGEFGTQCHMTDSPQH